MEVPSQHSKNAPIKSIEEYSSLQELNSDVEALTNQNFVLSRTAEVFERYLRKKYQASLAGYERFMEHQTVSSVMSRGTARSSFSSASGGSFTPSLNQTPSSSPVGKTSRSPAHSSISGIRISALFKIDMVDRELDESKITMDKLKRHFEVAMFLLEATEKNFRFDIMLIEEIRAGLVKFIKNSTDKRTGRIFYDKFLRFIESELHNGDRDIRKLNLNVKSSQVEYNRMVVQQQQKLELRERLHPVDLNKLIIENEELKEKFEQKTKKMMDFKKNVGKKGQNLVSMKSKLNDILLSLRNIKHEIKQKETKYKFTEEKEIKNVNELITAEIINQNIKRIESSYKSPNAHDYILVEVRLNELKSDRDRWERRCKNQRQSITLLEHQLKQLSPPLRKKSLVPSTYSYRTSKSLYSSKSADSVVRHFNQTYQAIPHCTPTTPTFRKW